MDLEYEYKDSRYNRAVNSVKAALFDILAMEKQKTSNLEQQLSITDGEDKKTIEEKLNIQKENLDKIVSNVDDIISSIEKLDSISIEVSNINNNELAIIDVDDESVKEAFNKDLKIIEEEKEDTKSNIKEKVGEVASASDISEESKKELKENTDIIVSSKDVEGEEKINEPTLKISQEENKDVNGETVENSNTDNKEIAQDKELDEVIKSVDNQLEKAQEIDKELEKIPESELTDEKLAFTRENKKVIKAILVKQAQLNNLKESRKKQKQILYALGLFNDYSYMKNTQNALEGSLKAKEKFNIKIDVNADKERQIEDLMVKASVYTSEGDTEMAQAIYDKINELNAEDVDVEGEEKGVELVKTS